MRKIDEAIEFSAYAHRNQKRKAFDQDYFFHPLEVLSLVSIMTKDENVQCAAILHDTVEDTDTTLEDIRERFGERVYELVSYDTETRGEGVDKRASWKERKQETIDILKRKDDPESMMIVLCDKISNLRSMHLMLLDQGDEMWNVFHNNNPLDHYWYYTEIAKAMEDDLKDYAVYKEYLFLIDAVFGKYLKKEEK